MLTTKEAAKILCVESATVRKYCRDGLGKEKEQLKFIRVFNGRRLEYRIKNEDLEYFKKKYLTVNN